MSDIYTDEQIRIMRNAALCKRCGVEIESTHVHDFVRCACDDDHGIFVDGGREYLRRGFHSESDYEDRSLHYEFEFAVMEIDGEHWVEMRLLEESELKVRRKVKAEEQAALDDDQHEQFDSYVYAYSVWRARAQEALIKEHERRRLLKAQG